jgi:hypothetical protein
MGFGEVIVGFLRLFLLIGTSGRLENLICKTLESVAVLDLVLSLGLEDADAKPSKSPSLGRYSLWCCSRSIVLTEWSAFLFLSWPLDEPG